MKKMTLTALIGALIMSCAPAQVVPTERAAPQAQAALPNLIPEGYDTTESCKRLKFYETGRVDYELVGIFPNQNRSGLLSNSPYTAKCPSFTVERIPGSKTVFKFVGTNYTQAIPFLNGATDQIDAPGFLKLGLTGAFIDFTKPGVVTISNPENSRLPGYTLAVRIPGSTELKPLLFDGKSYEVTYNPDTGVEVLRDLDKYRNNWASISWNPSSGVLIMDPNSGLPNP